MLASTAGCQQQLPPAGRRAAQGGARCSAECSATSCGVHAPAAAPGRLQEYHIRFGSQVRPAHSLGI